MSAVVDTSLSADATSSDFAEAMARAERDKERVVVTRDGRAVAALVPIEDFDALEAIEDAEDDRLGAEAEARWVAQGRPLGATLGELAARWGIDLTINAE